MISDFDLKYKPLRITFEVFASSSHYEYQITDQTKYVDKYFEVDNNGNMSLYENTDMMPEWDKSIFQDLVK